MARPALTTEQFITRAKSVHGVKYDYSLVEYKNNATKIKIICKQHGIYEQIPNNHLSGNGCKACCFESQASTAKSEFATKANIIHDSKYSYELVDYKTNKIKVSISCPIHGSFEQTPNDHLKGQGCPVCANITISENTGWTRTNFVEKCVKNNNGLGILYVLECFNDSEKFFKIGITSRSVKERYKSKTEMPYLYRVIDEIIGDPVEIYDLETKLHQINKENHYVPEIPFGGSSSECFSKYKEIT